MHNTHKKPQTKPKPAIPSTPVKIDHICAYDCVQLWYTIQHWAVLIIFPLLSSGQSSQLRQIHHVSNTSRSQKYNAQFNIQDTQTKCVPCEELSLESLHTVPLCVVYRTCTQTDRHSHVSVNIQLTTATELASLSSLTKLYTIHSTSTISISTDKLSAEHCDSCWLTDIF